VVAQGDETRAQVERILQSSTFRNAEALRRLLRYLADKSLSGEAESLKEYTVAVDALGKPSTYDPRQDSLVRIQLGRLRQKLTEYYLLEGKGDAIVVDLPKGHFTLNATPSATADIEIIEPPPAAVASDQGPTWRLVLILCGALVVCLTWAVYATLKSPRIIPANLKNTQWSSELDQLWQPLLQSRRPLLVSVSAPLFVGLQGAGLYRDRSANTWEEAKNSPRVAAVREALHSPRIMGRYYYTGFGEMGAIFQLGRLLASKELHISFAKSSDLSWQQLSDNNVILVGTPRLFTDQLRNLPADLELTMDETGVHVLHPQLGEVALFKDDYLFSSDESADGPDDGELYVLITQRPGPLGEGYVASFSSNRGAGALGAIRWFTEPAAARVLVSKIRKPSGELPKYFQLVLKVKYKNSVPTEVNYVMHRELTPHGNSAAAN